MTSVVVLECPDDFADGDETDRFERGNIEGKVAAFAVKGRIDHGVRDVVGSGATFVDGRGAVGRHVKLFISILGAAA